MSGQGPPLPLPRDVQSTDIEEVESAANPPAGTAGLSSELGFLDLEESLFQQDADDLIPIPSKPPVAWGHFKGRHLFRQEQHEGYENWNWKDWNRHIMIHVDKTLGFNTYKNRITLIVGSEESVKDSFENGQPYAFGEISDACWSNRTFQLYYFEKDSLNDSDYRVYRAGSMYVCVTLENKYPIHFNGQDYIRDNKELVIDKKDYKEIKNEIPSPPPTIYPDADDDDYERSLVSSQNDDDDYSIESGERR